MPGVNVRWGIFPRWFTINLEFGGLNVKTHMGEGTSLNEKELIGKLGPSTGTSFEITQFITIVCRAIIAYFWELFPDDCLSHI